MRDATPFYEATGHEIEVFERAWRHGLPVLLKGPPVAARPASSSTWRGAWNCRCTASPATTTWAPPTCSAAI